MSARNRRAEDKAHPAPWPVVAAVTACLSVMSCSPSKAEDYELQCLDADCRHVVATGSEGGYYEDRELDLNGRHRSIEGRDGNGERISCEVRCIDLQCRHTTVECE